jgi:ceramide glucosyltransferase
MAALIPAVAYLVLFLVKMALALAYARRYPIPTRVGRASEVTVLQAILSGDPGLEQVLADNLEELPEAEFLWLIDEEDAEGQAIAGRLRERLPAGYASVILFPPPPDSVSPKLFKLEGAWRESTREFCLVLDDDTRMPAPSLDALVEALDEADLATGLPFYRRGKTLPARLLAQFVNDSAALTYLPLPALREPISINGMAYALRRSTLEGLGGFAPLLRHLTDDLAVARHVLAGGGKIRQTPFPQEVETAIPDFAAYWRQQHRWFLFAILLLRTQSVGIRGLLLLLLGLHPLLLWAMLVTAALEHSLPAMGVAVAVLAVRWAVLAGLQRRFTGKVRLDPALSLLGELLQPLHLLHAGLVRTMRWRSRTYRVWDNDRFEPA